MWHFFIFFTIICISWSRRYYADMKNITNASRLNGTNYNNVNIVEVIIIFYYFDSSFQTKCSQSVHNPQT